MKLLIAEDEPSLLKMITQYLKREGYLCETASTYADAYRKIINFEYDCVILDLSLPGGDGIRLLNALRREPNETGVIIISARNSVEDRIRGLDEGADDYLVKPFNLSELNARLKAVIRRKTKQFGKMLNFGNLQIRLDTREVFANNNLLQLTRKEFDILVFLVRNKNRVVTKESIAEHLWGDYMEGVLSFDFIYAHVKNLRKKLAEQGCEEYLKTIYGIGYKFITT